MPKALAELPLEHQRRIAEAVAAPQPPPRWLDLGGAQIVSRAWLEWHRARGRDPKKKRRLPSWLRDRVIARDGLVCKLCGDPVEPWDVHVDHIHPFSLGGADSPDNLQVAHSRCNIRKGNRVDGEN